MYSIGRLIYRNGTSNYKYPRPDCATINNGWLALISNGRVERYSDHHHTQTQFLIYSALLASEMNGMSATAGVSFVVCRFSVFCIFLNLDQRKEENNSRRNAKPGRRVRESCRDRIE